MQHCICSLIGYEIRATDGDLGRVDEFYFDDETWTALQMLARAEQLQRGRHRQRLVGDVGVELRVVDHVRVAALLGWRCDPVRQQESCSGKTADHPKGYAVGLKAGLLADAPANARRRRA